MRCYLMRRGHIAAVEVLDGASDRAIIEQARAIFEERKTDYEGFEVWDCARFVYRSPELPPRYVSARTDGNPPYHLYLIGDDGVMRGSFEFSVESDEAAYEIAWVAFDVCSDRVARFELWHGSRRIVPISLAPKTMLEQAMANHQSHVVALVERIRDSEQAVAKSERLLARLKDLKTLIASGRSETFAEKRSAK